MGSVLCQGLEDFRIVDLPEDIRTVQRIEEPIVVHLAAMRDAGCAKDPEGAWSVNVEGTKAIVEAAERGGAERIIFASSCSIYGWQADVVDEGSKVEPTSAYGETKEAAEEVVKNSGIEHKVILRFATLFGASPNMRWDTLYNQFVKDALQGSIEVYEPQAWRPLLHVKDAARAIAAATAIPYGEITLNVGFGNFTKGGLAGTVARTLGADLKVNEGVKDKRSYRVSFDNAMKILPVPTRSPESALKEIALAA